MNIMTTRRLTMLLCWLLASMLMSLTSAYSAPLLSSTPLFGLGAVFLKPQGMKIASSMGNSTNLMDAANFFTDAFWTNKVGGGAKQLSPAQYTSLSRNQLMEFTRRYGMRRRNIVDIQAELLICRNSKQEIMGCVGIEVDKIPMDSLNGPSNFRAPLMSNLAVGRKFRRRGIAEELVQQAERMARNQWGYKECYLYVEKRNLPAIRLYQKLGYKRLWQDDTARTLLPMDMGGVQNTNTIIVCMRKRLDGGVFGRFLS